MAVEITESWYSPFALCACCPVVCAFRVPSTAQVCGRWVPTSASPSPRRVRMCPPFSSKPASFRRAGHSRSCASSALLSRGRRPSEANRPCFVAVVPVHFESNSSRRWSPLSANLGTPVGGNCSASSALLSRGHRPESLRQRRSASSSESHRSRARWWRRSPQVPQCSSRWLTRARDGLPTEDALRRVHQPCHQPPLSRGAIKCTVTMVKCTVAMPLYHSFNFELPIPGVRPQRTDAAAAPVPAADHSVEHVRWPVQQSRRVAHNDAAAQQRRIAVVVSRPSGIPKDRRFLFCLALHDVDAAQKPGVDVAFYMDGISLPTRRLTTNGSYWE